MQSRRGLRQNGRPQVVYLRERHVWWLFCRSPRSGCTRGRLPPFRVTSQVHWCLGSPIRLQVSLVILGDPRERAASTSTVAGVHGMLHWSIHDIYLTAVFSNLDRYGAGCLVPFPNPDLGTNALGCSTTHVLFEFFHTNRELLPTSVLGVQIE